jgi:hypothetical protein
MDDVLWSVEAMFASDSRFGFVVALTGTIDAKP